MPHRVVARGVGPAAQGRGGTVLYWRQNRLWRYGGRLSASGAGAPRQVLELPPFFSPGEPIEYDSDGATGGGTLRYLAVANTNEEAAFVNTELLALSGSGYEPADTAVPAAPRGLNRRPVSWLGPRTLLVQDFRTDPLGRLRSARFTVATVPGAGAASAADLAETAPLTGLPDSVLETRAAGHGKTVALQAFDQATNSFALYLRDLSGGGGGGPGRGLSALELPPGYKPAVGGRPAAEMAWSPDGRHLAVRFAPDWLLVWDRRNRTWVTRFARARLFLWLGGGRILLYRAGTGRGGTLSVGDLSGAKPPSERALGKVEGIAVRKLFRLAMMPGPKRARSGKPARHRLTKGRSPSARKTPASCVSENGR